MMVSAGRKPLILKPERNAAKPLDRARVRHCEIVNLAVKLVDDLPGERPRLLRRLQEELTRGETS
jgi:hypothetical protein